MTIILLRRHSPLRYHPLPSTTLFRSSSPHRTRCAAPSVRSDVRSSSPGAGVQREPGARLRLLRDRLAAPRRIRGTTRSEEHMSELQSPYDLVCRLLLEKKNDELQQH